MLELQTLEIWSLVSRDAEIGHAGSWRRLELGTTYTEGWQLRMERAELHWTQNSDRRLKGRKRVKLQQCELAAACWQMYTWDVDIWNSMDYLLAVWLDV